MSGLSPVFSAFISEITQLLASLWSLLLVVLSGLSSLLASLLPASIVVFLSTVWGVVLVVGLLVVATAINLTGQSDVYATLNRSVFRNESASTDGLDLRSLEEAAVTDDAGNFSASALETVTGLTPPEFILLIVQARGGRVKQTAIVRSLPWSKSTVSRYLDLLESEEAVARIKYGRENVVCLPDQVPADYNPE